MTEPLYCPHCGEPNRHRVAELLRQLAERPADQPADFGQLLTIGQVADKLQVNERTVRSYIDRGILPVVRLDERARPRVRAAALDALLREREHVAGGTDVCQQSREHRIPMEGKTKGRQLRSVPGGKNR